MKCSECNRETPSHLLTYVNSRFDDVRGFYCKKCYGVALRREDYFIKEMETYIRNCDGCGDEYDMNHLKYNIVYAGVFCVRCLDEAN